MLPHLNRQISNNQEAIEPKQQSLQKGLRLRQRYETTAMHDEKHNLIFLHKTSVSQQLSEFFKTILPACKNGNGFFHQNEKIQTHLSLKPSRTSSTGTSSLAA
ncbi:hypothetical protein OOT00_12965 [Desulfobotulus sp. H1]|uniref:Uncharacterized protein n=1 Tax=Desulfobotulus pelophilus TaxID=2823377 RepID=A0ABT3NBQ5_9BACT|nr:hypothetical protein [Desulfobotulus pelophilus]MCW7754896.1 hypothetical protein [Desulfobotulus pelophilus]